MENVRRSIGAAVGGTAGTLAYWLLMQRGIHILAAVGAGVGLGVSVAARTRSTIWGIVTGVLALVTSVLVEFLFRPFLGDPTLGYFLSHLDELPRNSLLSLAVVTVLGFYFARGRDRRTA